MQHKCDDNHGEGKDFRGALKQLLAQGELEVFKDQLAREAALQDDIQKAGEQSKSCGRVCCEGCKARLKIIWDNFPMGTIVLPLKTRRDKNTYSTNWSKCLGISLVMIMFIYLGILALQLNQIEEIHTYVQALIKNTELANDYTNVYEAAHEFYDHTDSNSTSIRSEHFKPIFVAIAGTGGSHVGLPERDLQIAMCNRLNEMPDANRNQVAKLTLPIENNVMKDIPVKCLPPDVTFSMAVIQLDTEALEKFDALFAGEYQNGKQMQKQLDLIKGAEPLGGEIDLTVTLDRQKLCEVA